MKNAPPTSDKAVMAAANGRAESIERLPSLSATTQYCESFG
jgi:hypothetical protein